jgi:hypothetical protein
VISRRHLRLTIALLLPLMVLRAMLPAGYMPVTENGELRMVMCSAGMQLPGNGDGNDHNNHQPASDTGSCPFASALVSVPPVQYVAAVVTAVEFGFSTQAADELPPSTGPPRTTAARAPPALS